MAGTALRKLWNYRLSAKLLSVTYGRIILSLCFTMALSGMPLAQTNFVYTNNNNYFTANTVSAYLISAHGAAKQIANSPFLTGGDGNGGNGYIAANRIAVCSKFLYAANDYSGNVSGFSVDPTTGDLTVVPGSPFAVGNLSNQGIALAVTSDCTLLFAANLDAFQVYAFQIQSNGELVEAQGSPISVIDQPGTLAVTPSGAFLAVSLSNVRGVAMYRVGSNGSLTAVPGSPFSLHPIAGAPGVMDFNCAGSRLYVPEIYDTVDVFRVASNGALELMAGSPFSSPSENYDSELSPSGGFLFASNGNAGANSFHVAAGGALQSVSGSPFSADLSSASGLSVNNSGTFLYVSDSILDEFSVMRIGKGGALLLAPGSPVATGVSGGLFSLVAYPPKTCAGSGSSLSSAPLHGTR